MSFDALLAHLEFGEDPSDPPGFAGRPPSGVPTAGLDRASWLFQGPLPFPHVLASLRAEAGTWRGKASRVNTHSMVEGGPAAAAVQRSPELLAFLRAQVPDGIAFEPTTSYYHWYADADDRVEPHRDQEGFFLGCILLLGHEHAGAPTSRFWLHPRGGAAIEVPLAQGEVVVFFSGAITHSRSAPGPGEVVNTLTWGFRLTPVARSGGAG